MAKSPSDIIGYLINKPYILLKEEIEEMTQEEAKKVWDKISYSWSDVCHRAGGRTKAAQEWTSLLRKMTLLERKAEDS